MNGLFFFIANASEEKNTAGIKLLILKGMIRISYVCMTECQELH